MVRIVSPKRDLLPGYVVTYPNREKASSRMTRAAVVAILLASALLMLVLTVGGWSKLDGLIPVNLLWSAVYLVAARYVWRWARGLLPIAAALATLMLTFAIVATTSLAGASWAARATPGYAPADTPFGGAGLGAQTMNTLVIVLAVIQATLVVVAMRAFAQGWNVEFETHADEVAAPSHGLDGR